MIYIGLIFLSIAVLFPFVYAALQKKYSVPVADFIRQLPARGHVQCYDKKGTPHQLPVSPAIEVKFILVNGRKTTLYLDTITLTPTGITGVYLKKLSLKKTIPLDAVLKVELQDGGKRYPNA